MLILALYPNLLNVSLTLKYGSEIANETLHDNAYIVKNNGLIEEGVIKTSIILRDGREFNISYIKGPDIISLLKDEVSQYTSAPFNVRIESETATFYRIPRVLFWEYVNQDTKLQDYVNLYYRNRHI